MSTDDSLSSRVPGNDVKLWLLMEANRWAVTAIVLSGMFCLLAVLVAIDPVPLGVALANADPVHTLFQAMITSIVTGVTLVVTINQVVLSQELGPAGDQRERMEGALSFRDDVAAELDEPVAPPEPAAFLLAMLDATADRANELRDAASDCPDSAVRDAATSFAEDVVENVEAVRGPIDDAQFGTFDLLQAALGFNYSMKIYEGKRIQALHGEGAEGDDVALDEAARDALASTVTLLEPFGPAREHIKTLYFQWELVNLSRAMLYAAVPALVVSIGALLTLGNAGSIGGTTLGVANQAWVVLLGATISLTPFALLISYVLRIATVAKRTLAIGPFVLRDTSRSGGEVD